MRRALALAGPVIGALLLAAGPAAAENPVLEPEDDQEVVEALAEATEVQDVCYGYLLQVYDNGSGQYTGDYATSSGGVGVSAASAPGCAAGWVELRAQVVYTSDFSESEDSAGWEVVSLLDDGAGPTAADLDRLGLSSGDLLDDGKSFTTLRNAVLALPALATESAGLPPVQLQPNEEPLPADAQPTGSPGSDWLRENGLLLAFCVAAIVGGVVLLLSSRSSGRPVAARPLPGMRTDPPPGYPPPGHQQPGYPPPGYAPPGTPPPPA